KLLALKSLALANMPMMNTSCIHLPTDRNGSPQPIPIVATTSGRNCRKLLALQSLALAKMPLLNTPGDIYPVITAGRRDRLLLYHLALAHL
ncbi:hypothetical protein SCD92_18430, partial [Gilvimarinus sp. SDUM040013]